VDVPQRLGIKVALSPDRQMMAVSGLANERIQLWEINSSKVRWEFPGHGVPVTGLAFSPDGLLLISGSFDNTALVWNVRE
jgi:WD40 repeat protein